MADEVSMALSWFANYSNFYSVLSVLVCFILMVVFILRLNGENLLSSSATHYNPVTEQRMVGLQNPFAVHLSRDKSSSLKDGLHIQLSFLRSSYVTVLWGVNIEAFQRELQLASRIIIQRLMNGNLFNGACFYVNDYGRFDIIGKPVELFVKCPDGVSEETLGQPPRKTYPLVVVTGIEDVDTHFDPSPVVLQFTVIHMKDSACPLDSHIVYQFLKNEHNQLLSLQPIFVSASDSTEGDGHTNFQNNRLSPTTSSGDSVHHEVNSVHHEVNSVTGTHSEGTSSPDSQTCSCKNKSELSASSSVHNHSHGQSQDDIENRKNNCGGCDCHVEDVKQTRGSSDVNKCTTCKHDRDGLEGTPDEDQLEETDLCVVCQVNSIVYTLLPCRHACVCPYCITQLSSCPICRGLIDSFFRLQSDDEFSSSQQSVQEDTEATQPVHRGWEWLNNRINELFGFN